LGVKEIIDRFNTAQDRLVLQAADLSLDTIASMESDKAIDLAPDYQRRERWESDRQSKLIESFLLNVPVPPIYLAEDDFGTYSVIDGKQRITAIAKFMRNKLTLTGLLSFKEINGLRFRDLPAALQNALRVRPYLRVVTLLKQSDPELKYEVFTRLNTGGEPLTPQEIRNVVFRGPLNDALIQWADNAFLLEQLKIKNKRAAAYREMLDVEYVLRFLTLAQGWQQFSGSYRDSMDRFMMKNRLSNAVELEAFRKSFEEAINTCKAIWGVHAFKRPISQGWRDQFLAGMYDAQMVAVSLLGKSGRARAVRDKSSILSATRERFLNDADFERSVRQATNTPSRIVYRIQIVQSILTGS